MKPHRTDWLSLTFGLVFLAIAAWWLVAQLVGLALPVVGWFLAGGLILLGVLGLLGALQTSRNGPAQVNEVAGPGASADPQP